MPYVRCSHCGIPTYTAPPYMFAADCPVCGDELLPAALSGKRERPSVIEQEAEARAQFALRARGGAGTV